MKKRILVIGSNGQLGKCLRKISADFENKFQFYFSTSEDLDVTDFSNMEDYFKEIKPHYCINASAYTAVDLAETETEKAYAINAEAVENMAKICSEYKTTFIHVSTDYVFDGETEIPYSEDDFTNPINVYGTSKRKGEEMALEENPKTIILRTSWLYSEFNKNFVLTMLRLFSEKDKLNVVSDQFGQPTYAGDLAEAILKIIKEEKDIYGIYHFSNYPETTWYDFAKKIAEISESRIILNAIQTLDYPTPAKRPVRSTMCLDKIENDFGIELKHWENSLEDCIELIKE